MFRRLRPMPPFHHFCDATCDTCDSTGRVTCPGCDGEERPECPECLGTGEVECPVCAGESRPSRCEEAYDREVNRRIDDAKGK